MQRTWSVGDARDDGSAEGDQRVGFFQLLVSNALGGFLEFDLFCLKGIQSGSCIPNAMAMPSFARRMDPLSSIIIPATIKLRELDETGGSRFITDTFVSVRLYMPVLTSSLESQEETLAEGSIRRSRRSATPARKEKGKAIPGVQVAEQALSSSAL